MDRKSGDLMKPIENIDKGNMKDALSFGRLAQSAQVFLTSQKWCKRIRQGYLDVGWEGILAVFFFEFEPAEPGVDESVWVIVGDIPAACICNDNPDGPSALNSYVDEMQKWVDAAKVGDPVEELIPVNVPPNQEHAEMLESRLEFIRKELLS